MKKISANDLQKITKQNPKTVVINVLSREIYAKGHVPDSINIPVEDENFLEQVKQKVKDKNQQIIVYCASLECSASTEAAKILEENGYTNVLDFKGGMKEWSAAGNRVDTKSHQTESQGI